MDQRLSKQLLESAYDREKDATVKARILLVLRVLVDGVWEAEAARELHMTRSWASKWVKRFEAESLEGLKTRKRSGRPPKSSSLVEGGLRPGASVDEACDFVRNLIWGLLVLWWLLRYKGPRPW